MRHVGHVRASARITAHYQHETRIGTGLFFSIFFLNFSEFGNIRNFSEFYSNFSIIKAQIGAAIAMAFEIAILDHFGAQGFCIGHYRQNDRFPGNGPIEHARPFVTDLSVSLLI